MSFAQNTTHYLNLMRDFLEGSLSAADFEQQFAALWRKDRDQQYAIARQTGMSLVELAEQQRSPVDELLDSVFTACDAFNPNESTRTNYECNEDQLRELVRSVIQSFPADHRALDDQR